MSPPAQDADVIIIGTGQAGVPLAARLAAAGKRVVIMERGRPGGTCVNAGCTPTKTLIASAHAAHVARTCGRFGVQAQTVTVDFRAVMSRVAGIVARWQAGIERKLASAGDRLRFVRGHGRFVAPLIVEVNGERYQAPQIVVDVGARPAIPALPGIDAVAPLTSTGALVLEALPPRLIVMGAGYVACELGQAFRRLGSEVTIVGRSPKLLPREDPEVSDALAGAFRAEGIRLELGRSVARLARHAGQASDDVIGVELEDGTSLRGSHVLVATGRTANTSDLGCEAAGIALDGAGCITVGERYETTATGVFAVGDCTPGPRFTHVAWDDHRVLFDILTGRPARRRSDRIVPYTVFTDPQVAGVGLSEQAARARGLEIEVASMPFGSIARAIETDQTAGVVRIVIDSRSERLLGATVVGAEAGELIHVFGMLLQAGAPARTLVDAEMVHPTFAEGLQTALMRLPRFALS